VNRQDFELWKELIEFETQKAHELIEHKRLAQEAMITNYFTELKGLAKTLKKEIREVLSEVLEGGLKE